MSGGEAWALRSRRFEVTARLGQGGMGVVYEAVDRERGMRVALKTLRQLGGEALVRFKREFRLLQDLHHPNLVSLGELVEEEGTWFFTMELVRGCGFLQYVRPAGQAPEPSAPSTVGPARSGVEEQTVALPRPAEAVREEETVRLRPAVARAPAPPPQPVRALVPVPEPLRFDEQRLRSALGQLALGLHALHRAGKVHRDVKPSNILVTEQGRVVLLDFGILSDVGQAEEAGGPAVGTASYMAPEQVRGEPPAPAADWYSLGVLLYQALTGYLPFSGTPREVMDIKQREEPVPPQARVAGLPEDLQRLCWELLRIDPVQRPGDEEVLQRLGLQEAASRDDTWSTSPLPFVGRRAELVALHEALGDSRRGPAVVVLVQGESGVGKSRLVRHFLAEVGEFHHEAVLLSGRCYERESVPYKGVDGVVDSLARYLGGPGAALVAELLPPQAALLSWLFPVLGEVKGFPPAPPAGTGELLRQRLAAFGALRELLARLAERGPVVLAIEDLQWADRDGLAVLDELTHAPGLLLVATVRGNAESSTEPEPAQAVRFWREARVLPLEGLPASEALDLVGQLHGQANLEEARRIVLESNGHPLFIDALVRYRAAEGGAAPVRLEEALQARVQLLEPASRLLLELLVVGDRPLPNAVAAHAAGLDSADYARRSASLRASHLALTSGPAATDTLELAHDRVRLAMEPLLTRAQRQSWHARLALALEALGQGTAEQLAHHWHEAGHVDRAIPYYERAAREAAAMLAFAREALLYRTVLELRAWEPQEQRRLYLALAEALAHAGRGGEAGEAFLAATVGAAQDEALNLRQRAVEQFLLSGHLGVGLSIARQVAREVGLGYPRSPAAALGSLLWLQLQVRLLPESFRRRPLEQVQPVVRRRMEACHSLGSLASIEPVLGGIFGTRYLLLAAQAGQARHVCRGYSGQVISLSITGVENRARVEHYLQRMERLLPECEGDEVTRGYYWLARGWSDYLFGRFAPAREHFGQALNTFQQCAGIGLEQDRTWYLGSSVLGVMGELSELTRFLVLPVAEARERNDLYGLLTLRLGTTTLTWLARGDSAGARREARELISLWTREGYSLQHYLYLLSELMLDLYAGESQVALRRLEEALPQLKRYFLWRSQTVRCRVGEARARALLQEAARGGSEGQARLREVEAQAQQLEREGLEYAKAQARLVRAAAAVARGQLEEARAGYQQAVGELEATGLGLHAAAARLRLGELLGGEEGHLLVAQARAWMHGQGIADVQAMAALFAPGGYGG